jgi:FkbM family methyltransferase
MSKRIKNWIRNGIPEEVKKFVSYSDDVEYGTTSFSQFGEDMILRNFFLGKQSGFYIDIGAHHPVRYSNTYFFYKKGWNGINIDPLPGIKEQFESLRPRDLFLDVGLSDDPAEIQYYRFKNPLQNTFSSHQAELVNKEANPLEEVCWIKVKRLEDVLDQHLPPGIRIDFMSVDAEGYDLKVLLSNNWNKYRPARLLVEDFDFEFPKTQSSPIVEFLNRMGYEIVAFVNQSIFFKDVRVH